MRKISKVLLIFLFIMILGIQNVNATTQALPQEVKETMDNFFDCLEDGDEEIYNYIDTTNVELYNNVDKYLESVKIVYEIKEFTEQNGIYSVKVKIAAEGIGWSINGMTTNYEIKKYDSRYIITNTDLFDTIGGENVFKFVMKMMAIIFGGIIIAIIVIAIIIISAVIASLKKSK